MHCSFSILVQAVVHGDCGNDYAAAAAADDDDDDGGGVNNDYYELYCEIES